MVDYSHISKLLPYDKPFLFVEGLTHLDENGADGYYTFTEDHDFFKGHFKENPVVPGVILTETMAQVGLVCLGIFLLNEEINKKHTIAFTSMEMEFLKPVFPNEKVTVISSKIYFRFGKLKCRVQLFNAAGELAVEGTMAGIFKPEIS